MDGHSDRAKHHDMNGRGYLLWVVDRVQAAADATRADYFRAVLEQERSELQVTLSGQVKALTACMTTDKMRALRYFRQCIRVTEPEREIRLIDRMVATLDKRFPDQ
jgi:hypothetical protein